MIRYSYEYDRLKSITYPDHPENNVAFTYGTDGMSQELLNNHNGLGRLLLREDATGATEYFYDSYGNVKTERRTLVVPNFVNDSCGIVTTFDMGYSYDNFGRIIKMTYPDGQDVEYAYDAGGNLQKVRNGTQGGFFVSHIGYDKFGQRTSMLLGDGTTTCYSYSPERR
jgi:YD repeat-containing protein